MLRRRFPETGAFFRLLLGRSSLKKSSFDASSPFRHFVQQLLGGVASTSRAPSALAAASETAGAGGGEPASLTVHFLRHYCGLAEADAAKAAARVRLRSTKNAHAVLALLRDTLGLPPASVGRVVAAFPRVLSSTTVFDRFDFYLQELGLSPNEVRRFLGASPNRFLTAGLEGRLRPNHRLLREILGTDENVLAAIKQSMELIYENLEVVLLPKVQVLRNHGVTEEVIVKLIITHPKALVHRSTRFNEGLAAMKDLGVSPDSGVFPYAFGLFAKIHQSKWDHRIENYLSLGWTEEQIRRAFIRHPYCMSVSDDKVRQRMQFLNEKLGLGPEQVASCPVVLSLSYEKRLLPRCMVLDILVSRGVIKNGIRISHLLMPEKKFMERYVNRYREEVPQVVEAYGAKAGCNVK
ncbi:hypothetical protein BS78_07G117300 [Paspalum vaginatum]|nr:hypothetical protein BS78_07G117300 [Paspalum vaginatum]